MALTVNGVTPTKVIVNQNGTDVELTQIDVVKDGNRVTVWQKELLPPVIYGAMGRIDIANDYWYFECNIHNHNEIDVRYYLNVMCGTTSNSADDNGMVGSNDYVNVSVDGIVRGYVGEMSVTVTFTAEDGRESSIDFSPDNVDWIYPETTTTTTT